MSQLSVPAPSFREVRSDDGSLRVERRGERALRAELVGRVSLAHAQALTTFADAWMDVAPVNLSLFLDLGRVSALDFAAQGHLASWAREKALCFDRLHVVLEDPALIGLVRAMFMALPVRAYLYRDHAPFEAACARLG
jgi:hypothetical protein